MSVSDDFNRANSGSLGANWTEVVNALGIVSNSARPGAGDFYQFAIYSGVTWNDIQSSQIVITAVHDCGVLTRGSGSGSFSGYMHLFHSGGLRRIFRVDAGSFTELLNADGTVTPGATVKGESTGSTHRLYYAGSQIGTDVTDATYASGKPGIYAKYSAEDILDDWVGTGEAAGGTTYTLTAAQGTITLSGQAVTFRRTRVMPASQGTYSLAGQTAALKRGLKVAANQGSYALSGQPASLLYARKLAAAQGSYTLAGQAVAFLKGRTLSCAAGTYTLSGQAANFLRTYVLSAETGLIVLAGQNANLRKAGGSSSGDESTRRRRLIRRKLGVKEPISEEDEEILFLLAMSL